MSAVRSPSPASPAQSSAAAQWPRQTVGEMNKFYGNPDPEGDGRPNRTWEAENLIRVMPPYPMVLAWAPSAPLRSFMFHRLAAPALRRVLAAILVEYPEPWQREVAGLHLWGGAYNFRLMRGGSALSMHSWGCAVDLNPAVNWFGRRYVEHLGMMPRTVVRLFEAEGFVWGGLWRKPDAMHFQAART